MENVTLGKPIKYIALLDILGYRQLIMNNDMSDISSLFENIPVYIQSALSKGKTVQTTDRYHFDVSQTVLNSIIISDTLIFWTHDDNAESLFELIDCMKRLLMMMFNTTNLFLRGCITAGEFYHYPTGYIQNKEKSAISHPMIFGNGLIYAHEFEVSLALACCMIDERATSLARKNNGDYFDKQWSVLVKNMTVVEFDTPFKDGHREKQWLINWVSENTHPTRQEFLDGFATNNRDTSHPDVKIKIEHTVRFYDLMKHNIV